MGPMRLGNRSHGAQGNFWANIPAQGEGMVDFNSVLSGVVTTCMCVLIYECVISPSMVLC